MVLPPRIRSDPQSWQSQGRVEREAEKKSCHKKKTAPATKRKHMKMCTKSSWGMVGHVTVPEYHSVD